jgi:anti-repressor protein
MRIHDDVLQNHIFARGEIYWCDDFPQSNRKRKSRPVCVINPLGFSTSILVCKVTHTVPAHYYPTQFGVMIGGKQSVIDTANTHMILKSMLGRQMYALTNEELMLLERAWMSAGRIKKRKENAMQELIKVNYDNEQPIVSARDLHEFLDQSTDFRHWFPRMIEYGFTEGADFNTVIFDRVQREGGRIVTRPVTDYAMTVEMAKEICMIQRNDKGKQARQYFIDLEKKWNSPEQIMSRALRIADRTIESLKENVSALQPKAEFYDAVVGSKTACDMAVVAKTLNFKGVGRNNLFEILREQKVLDPDNRPYQAYVDRGWFRMVESKYTKPDGSTCISFKTVVYQRGVDGISKMLSGLGYTRAYDQLVLATV